MVRQAEDPTPRNASQAAAGTRSAGAKAGSPASEARTTKVTCWNGVRAAGHGRLHDTAWRPGNGLGVPVLRPRPVLRRGHRPEGQGGGVRVPIRSSHDPLLTMGPRQGQALPLPGRLAARREASLGPAWREGRHHLDVVRVAPAGLQRADALPVGRHLRHLPVPGQRRGVDAAARTEGIQQLEGKAAEQGGVEK